MLILYVLDRLSWQVVKGQSKVIRKSLESLRKSLETHQKSMTNHGKHMGQTFFRPAETPGHGRSGSDPPPEGELPSCAKARALPQIPVNLNDGSLAEAISINVRLLRWLCVPVVWSADTELAALSATRSRRRRLQRLLNEVLSFVLAWNYLPAS